MESARGLIIPILNDYVLSPEVYYGDELTGIYFSTNDDQFGRITFDNLDSIKISRGEQLPFEDDWKNGKEMSWVYEVDNSKWLQERFFYENAVYGSSYEFGGDVEEMLTDFHHYIFQFHDQFVEVLARGFWWEKNKENLFKKPLQEDHPFLPLAEHKFKVVELHGIKIKVVFNELEREILIENARFCPQKLIEFKIEYEGKYSLAQTLLVFKRKDKVLSSLRGLMGKPKFVKEGIATYEEIFPLLDKYVSEVAERRKSNKYK